MTARTLLPYFSGTSNIVVPLRQSEYPPEFRGASRLTYYASLFSSLEVNATFYKLPKGATVRKWSESVPDGFRFTFKVPKTVTHAKGFQFASEDIERFAEVVAEAGDKRGCLLLQLPPSAKRERHEELEGVLQSLSEEAPGWTLAVELRDNSWYERSVYRLLQHYQAVLVSHDMPASATPPVQLSERSVYLRYHGPEGGYRGSYPDEFLAGEADRIAGWLKDGREVYAYFNNTMGAALANLQTLNALVAQRTDAR
ncbi:MAG: DUF72 domain-containing protein [Chitinophagaceae bacterium]|nr:MAG: DUF72 domain-containing protein [Chitinophagaceae bacterium]